MRQFKTAREKQIRRESAFFWEERNVWYSDIWLDLKGTPQSLNYDQMRLRSAAYPIELPYRLINMFSVKGDTVLDPCLGTGTTTLSAMAACRNSIGFEIEPSFRNPVFSQMDTITAFSNQQIRNRIINHIAFVQERFKTKGPFKHINKHYGFPVVTSQEKELLLNQLLSTAQISDSVFEVSYSEKPQEEFCGDWQEFIIPTGDKRVAKKRLSKRTPDETAQLTLLDQN